MGLKGICRLFLALLPDEETRESLSRTAAEAGIPQDAGLRPVNPRRYHATLHFLGEYPAARPDLAAAVERLAGGLHVAAFDWTLDRVRSFHGRRPPRVLCGGSAPEALQQLWQRWHDLLLQELPGLALDERFVPHVTLGYGRAVLPAAAVTPVHWPVRELALLESHPGQGDYRMLASWVLPPG
ncbi:2'-5' RNA ligase [Dyella agri]